MNDTPNQPNFFDLCTKIGGLESTLKALADKIEQLIKSSDSRICEIETKVEGNKRYYLDKFDQVEKSIAANRAEFTEARGKIYGFALGIGALSGFATSTLTMIVEKFLNIK